MELKSLQVLRIIAAASVVYYHINAAPVFGSFGVDIFFVISGFVIAMVIANQQTATAFAYARITRIVPLYWLLTTGLLGLAYFKPNLLNSTTADLNNYMKSLLFIPYFKENGALHPMLAVGWTLNYEMFFYCCTWVAMIIARQFYIPITILLLSVTYVVFNQYTDNSVATAFFTNSLIFEFVLGMIAFLLFQYKRLPSLPKSLLILATLLLYGFMATAEAFHLEINRFWLYGIPSLLLVLSIIQLEPLFRSQTSKLVAIMVALGNASYALYLSHYYVIEGVKKIIYPRLNIVNTDTAFSIGFIVSLSLLVGYGLYRYIDRPLVRYFKRKAPSKKLQSIDISLTEATS
jgi:peptidoglycan/LPS O-acetylase OafA/YrhL